MDRVRRGNVKMEVRIEFDREDDGRWSAEAVDLPGVLVYGATKREAEGKVEALALRVVAASLRG